VFFDSIAGRAFHAIVKSIAAACIVYFAARSLVNTIDFTSLAYPNEEWTGIVGGLFIQFSPNVFFALASYSADPIWKGVWLTAGIVFTGIDGGTNIGDRRNAEYVASLTPQAANPLVSPEMAKWASALGYTLDVAVAGAEELFAFFVGMIISDVVRLYELSGKEQHLPGFLTFVKDAASRSRGGGGQRPQQHQNQPQRNDNQRRDEQRGNNQPVRTMDRNAVDELLNRRENGHDNFVQRIDDRR
jgi:hypothetical protein